MTRQRGTTAKSYESIRIPGSKPARCRFATTTGAKQPRHQPSKSINQVKHHDTCIEGKMNAHRDVEVSSLAVCVGHAKNWSGEDHGVVGKDFEQTGGGRVG
jgi:hypothetical protein